MFGFPLLDVNAQGFCETEPEAVKRLTCSEMLRLVHLSCYDWAVFRVRFGAGATLWLWGGGCAD